MASATITTADQLLANPPSGRCELVRGELRMMTPANAEHGWLVAKLTIAIGVHVQQHQLGYVFGAETGFLIESDPDSVRAPDVAFVCGARVAGKIPRTFFPGPPDLAVEILSPSETALSVRAKTEQWLKCGCREVWLIDPKKRSATRCRLFDQNVVCEVVETLTSDLLPALELPVASLFEL